MSNQVTLTFAGDSSKLESAFKSVGSAADGMKGKVEDAGHSVKSSGEAYDRAGEAADQFDTKSMGARDGVTGIQDTMTGFSNLAKGDYVNSLLFLGSGFSDIGSSLYNFVIPTLKSLSIESIKNVVNTVRQTAATVASKTAQVAVAVATKAWAAAQWLINAAMTANPIGLVIAAIALLVVGIIYAYKHSEVFRKTLDAAFKGILAIAKVVGGWFVNTLWPWMKSVFDKISLAAVTVKNAIVNAFTASINWLKALPGKIWTAVSSAWDRWNSAVTNANAWVARKFGDMISWLTGLGGKVWGAVSGTWTAFNKSATAAKDWVVKQFNTLVSNLASIPGRIGRGFVGMFDGLKNAFKSAMNWIIGKWNSLHFGIPAIDTHIPGVGKIGGGSFGVPQIPYFHTGGVVSGALGSEHLAMVKAGERITAGTSASDGSSTLVLQSDGTKTGDLLVRLLKETIRVRGGNVQVVLGNG
jgi:hypothetical protein